MCSEENRCAWFILIDSIQVKLRLRIQKDLNLQRFWECELGKVLWVPWGCKEIIFGDTSDSFLVWSKKANGFGGDLSVDEVQSEQAEGLG